MPIRLQGTPIVPVCVVLVFMAVFALPHEVTADEPGWRLIGTEGPPPRHSPGMVYDSARNVVVMFGGITGREREGILYGDTWEWDGVEWKKAADTGPSPRLGHSMVYDSWRQVVVLFGGNDGNFQNDTWEWDGTEWKLAATDGPRPRGRHSMAYDQERGVVVLFGGIPRDLGDTWEWDGVEWRQAAGSGPEGRSRSAMVYDEAAHRIILFGGRSQDGAALGDTWAWDGKEWTRLDENTEFARSRHGMVYHRKRGTIVAHGVSFNGRNEMIEWDGTKWKRIDTAVLSSRI